MEDAEGEDEETAAAAAAAGAAIEEAEGELLGSIECEGDNLRRAPLAVGGAATAATGALCTYGPSIPHITTPALTLVALSSPAPGERSRFPLLVFLPLGDVAYFFSFRSSALPVINYNMYHSLVGSACPRVAWVAVAGAAAVGELPLLPLLL